MKTDLENKEHGSNKEKSGEKKPRSKSRMPKGK
jgi:hypothetical protein